MSEEENVLKQGVKGIIRENAELAKFRESGGLDKTEILIMNVFAGMNKLDRRIMIAETMGGPMPTLATPVNNAELLNKFNELDGQEIVANLDALVNKGMLSIKYSAKGTPNYSLAKKGFDMINKISKEETK